MSQTLTTDRLKQITDAISAEPHDYESIYDSIKHGEIAAMARELLANRGAQPVDSGVNAQTQLVKIVERLNMSGYEINDGPVDFTNASDIVEIVLDQLNDAVCNYTAPPAPVVNPEFTGATAVPTFEEWLSTQENKPLGWVRDSMKESYDACRAAMLAQPVSQGGQVGAG
nr:hypothetical protein [uncultured Serratia sp.]